MTENGIRLIYSAEFIANAENYEIDYALSHELMHVLNYHFTRGFDMMAEFGIGTKEFFTKYAPMADLPVNYALQDMEGYKKLSNNMLTYSKAGIDYDDFPTFESIVRHMRANPNEEKKILKNIGFNGNNIPTIIEVDDQGNVTVIQQGNGSSSIGDGNGVVVIPKVTQEGKREYMRDIAEIVRSTHRAAGSAPYEMQRAIQGFLDELDDEFLKGWALLEQLLVGERSINKGYTRCYGRMNRRTKMIPGKKRIRGFSAMMVVDESGSMSDDEVNQAFALAKKVVLRENNDKLYLVHWDTEPTEEVEELQHESDLEEVKRNRCGGTDFSEFFSHDVFKQHDYDLYVCVTDGYPCGWPKTDPDKPLVWIITQGGGYSQWESGYGKGLAVDVTEG